MFDRPPLVPVFAGLIMILVVLGTALGSWPDWWSLYLPQPVGAAFRLREKRYLVRSDGCAQRAIDDWHTVLTSKRPESWFRSIVVEATTPAGLVYGLVGLQATDSAEFTRRMSRVSRALLADTMTVLDSESVSVLRLQDVIPNIETGLLLRSWTDIYPRPEC